MNDRIPLPYPYWRLTYRLYRLAAGHPAVYWLTAPVWWTRWQLFVLRGRRDARHLGRRAVPVCGNRPITDFAWAVDPPRSVH